MGRTAKPGISFYRMDAGHIKNKKVRLLFNEFDSDGYYIWHSLVDYAYAEWGYYFDLSDPDVLELFASEYCKKPVKIVREVIAGCIRRDLFNKDVADMFGILTSDMMQETFLIATSDRRAKESVFHMREDWLLLDFSEEVPKNIAIIPGKKKIIPGKNDIIQPNNSQRREEKNREEENKEDKRKGIAPASPAPPKPDGEGKLKDKQADMQRRRKEFHTSVFTHDGQFLPEMLGGFFRYWTEPNRSQTKMRWEMEPTWDLSRRLGTWEKNDVNWNKGKGAAGSATAERHCNGEEVEYLYQRFLEGAELAKIILEKHCNFLLQAGLIELDERFVSMAVNQRIKTLTGTNNAGELRMILAYQSGKWPADPDCQADEPNRTRIAKKFALIDYFQKSKILKRKTITDAPPDEA